MGHEDSLIIPFFRFMCAIKGCSKNSGALICAISEVYF